MQLENVTINVPASSANLGLGFDSLGVALSMYLTITNIKPAANWHVAHNLGKAVPSDATNLIVIAAKTLVPDLVPLSFSVKSDIPLARGLGSSAAAIVAGLLLADVATSRHTPKTELLKIATKIEGHPDNIAPALLGNLTICSNATTPETIIPAAFPKTKLVAFVPSYQLSTTKSRNVLPQTLDYHTAIIASSKANILVACLLQNDLQRLRRVLSDDDFHEPYRTPLVAELKKIKRLAAAHNAIGTYLSGAGPTVMSIFEPNADITEFCVQLQQFSGTVLKLHVPTYGAISCSN